MSTWQLPESCVHCIANKTNGTPALTTRMLGSHVMVCVFVTNTAVYTNPATSQYTSKQLYLLESMRIRHQKSEMIVVAM